MDAVERLYVLEANPNPQIVREEDFADSAEKAGYHYGDLLQELLNAGMRWRTAKAA
jgi:D-alanine-D-alanine ligase